MQCFSISFIIFTEPRLAPDTVIPHTKPDTHPLCMSDTWYNKWCMGLGDKGNKAELFRGEREGVAVVTCTQDVKPPLLACKLRHFEPATSEGALPQ